MAKTDCTPSGGANRRKRVARQLLLFLLPALLLPAAGSAIVIRHDQADARYVVAEADFPQVFFLHTRYDNRVCVATLIATEWAITAAHCAYETPLLEAASKAEPYDLSVAGQPRQVRELVIHPDYERHQYDSSVDLALLRLDRPVEDVQPIGLYRDADEEGAVALFLGWGFTGIGTVGRSANDGQLRRARNRVQEAGKWLRFRFDDPREAAHQALPLEGVPGLGDSGGPALLERDGELLLMGVALGELEDPANPNARQGRYGATPVYERISSHQSWIDEWIAQ